ncbi:hypothetical protein AB0O01_01035 [Streptomyces sp. NPDC093252]|uniref:hypothetical protein n=1 Tax=Streptomyces sp. NPDC093252 TaxID=3154980 RepID=UPI00342397F9
MGTNRRRAGRAVSAAVVSAVLVAVTAACGGDSEDTAPAGGLTAALGGIPQDRGGQPLVYTDVPEVRRLTERDPELYAVLSGFGIPELAQADYAGEPARAALGFDETVVDSSVQIGADAVRLTGRFDVDAVTGAMKERGWTETESKGAPLLTQDGTRITVSPSVRSLAHTRDAALPPLTDPETSIASDTAFRAVADCLGDDTYHATLYGKDREGHLPGLTLFGIGARAGDDGTSTERLCAVTRSAEAARTVADALRPATAAGERFAGVRIEVGEGAAPVVTMEWDNSVAELRPGSQNQTGQLPQLLITLR